MLSAGLLAPLYLKWALVFEEPISHTLWLAKATPRVWLHEGEVIDIGSAPTAYGRVGIRIRSSIASSGEIQVCLALPAGWAGPSAEPPRVPPGGLRLRLRVPGARRAIRSVSVGGEAWRAFNASASTVGFEARDLYGAGMLKRLRSVVVKF